MRPLTIAVVLLAIAPAAWAEPRDTVWLEDVHLQPAATSEASFFYEFQAADLKALEEGTDLLSLRLAAGLGDRLELAPILRFRQRGDEEFRLHDLGGMLRARVVGDAAAPRLLVYTAYFNDLGTERDHRLVGGATGRAQLGRLFASADLRGSAFVGGDMADTRELWVGAAAGYAFLPERRLSAGLETFLITPFGGARMSDPTFGESAESSSFYYGPNVSFRVGPLWSALSIATGYPVSDPASHVLVRWMIGLDN